MLLTIKQFSKQYKIPVYTCYQHIENKLLPAEKIGSTYLIDSDRLNEYQQNLDKQEEKKSIVGGRPSKVSFSKLHKSLRKPEIKD